MGKLVNQTLQWPREDKLAAIHHWLFAFHFNSN